MNNLTNNIGTEINKITPLCYLVDLCSDVICQIVHMLLLHVIMNSLLLFDIGSKLRKRLTRILLWSLIHLLCLDGYHLLAFLLFELEFWSRRCIDGNVNWLT